MISKSILAAAVIGLSSFTAAAQGPIELENIIDSLVSMEADTMVSDTLTQAEIFVQAFENGTLPADSTLNFTPTPLPVEFFLPQVYTSYVITDTLSMSTPLPADNMWVSRDRDQTEFLTRFINNYWVKHPELVKYNVRTLPEPPEKYRAEIKADDAKVSVMDLGMTVSNQPLQAEEKKRINWLQNFDFAAQFSQAYISPNWYQGGNNNLNLIINAVYNVKLNPAFYPKVLFETTAQYRLAINSTPDDPYRGYSLSENLLQINSKFGYKATTRWYYSANLVFKTPIFNGYKRNTETRTAALLSPGELNVGLGMTYNFTNPKKTFTFGASLSPLSYNLKMVLNRAMKVTDYGVEAGHRTASQVGSSADLTATWKLAYNITWASRMFLFSDYSYMQGDWQNTFTFSINKYLSTKLFIDLRYDSSTPALDGTKWRYWQLKEIFSFGFTYKI